MAGSRCRAYGRPVADDAPADLRPGVLLDVDGTLLDTNYLHVLAWWRALRDAPDLGAATALAEQAVIPAADAVLAQLYPSAALPAPVATKPAPLTGIGTAR